MSCFVFHVNRVVEGNVTEILVLTQRVEAEPYVRTVFDFDYPAGTLAVPAPNVPLGALHLTLEPHMLAVIRDRVGVRILVRSRTPHRPPIPDIAIPRTNDFWANA